MKSLLFKCLKGQRILQPVNFYSSIAEALSQEKIQGMKPNLSRQVQQQQRSQSPDRNRRDRRDRVKERGGDKMVEEKDLNWPPLTNTPKSQLSAKRSLTKRLECTKTDSTSKDPQRGSRRNAFTKQSNPMLTWWVAHKLENNYIAEVLPQNKKMWYIYTHTHIHPVEYYSSINRKIFW